MFLKRIQTAVDSTEYDATTVAECVRGREKNSTRNMNMALPLFSV
jgi:hypothetical protein